MPSNASFSLRQHPQALEIDALAREIERQDGTARMPSVIAALRHFGLELEAGQLEAAQRAALPTSDRIEKRRSEGGLAGTLS